MDCPYCKIGVLEFVAEFEPWCDAHYQCTHCNSTYSIEFIETTERRTE